MMVACALLEPTLRFLGLAACVYHCHMHARTHAPPHTHALRTTGLTQRWHLRVFLIYTAARAKTRAVLYLLQRAQTPAEQVAVQ